MRNGIDISDVTHNFEDAEWDTLLNKTRISTIEEPICTKLLYNKKRRTTSS